MNSNIARNFSEFSEAIKRLPSTQLTLIDLASFRLAENEKITMYYAPFDWINAAAKVVIVGITPGQDSMLNAFRAAASSLKEGRTTDEASELGKRRGSFSNMKSTMARMFDDIGLPAALGISQSKELFENRQDLIHATSCVRYPALVWSKKKNSWTNYTGHSPKLLKWGTSRRYIEEVLAEELRQFPRALIVPCGKAVTEALQHLSSKGVIDPLRCLFGFPHASGANVGRKKQFDELRGELRERVSFWHREYLVPEN